VPKELARLETIVHGYEAQLAAGCKRTLRCTYDRGAFGRQVDKNEHISEDLNHSQSMARPRPRRWPGRR